jgi:hypothetical protein
MSYFGTIDKLLDDYNECKNDPYIGIVQCDTPPEKSSSGDSRVLLLDFAPRPNDKISICVRRNLECKNRKISEVYVDRSPAKLFFCFYV